MAAGSSAWSEAARCESRVAEYLRCLEIERARAQSFRIAGRTEAELAARLRALRSRGWQLLEDRRWPGSRSANVDAILIGPGGVLVIDVKAWAEPDVVDGRLYRGQSDAQDELDKLHRVTELITEAASEVGLAPTEIVPVMVLMNQRGTDTQLGRVQLLDEHSIVPWIVRRGPRLDAEQLNDLVELLDRRLPPATDTTNATDGADSPAPDHTPSTAILDPVVPLGRHFRAADDTLFDADELHAAVLAEALVEPIEQWMTFLHPEQLRLVKRLGVGPARIRGAAGTGKTVVALHRAAYLAESTREPILFTSFIKTLPPALAGLYRRLSPATAEQVEFVNLHAWASRFLIERGHRRRVNPRAAETAWARAWLRHGRGSELAVLGVESDYWRDEIKHVIKGRGITEFADYARLPRLGRRTRLTETQRQSVWALYVEYEQHLRTADIIDFEDQITLALNTLRERPLDRRYGAVIVDEVQDLSCQALRLLAELSGGGSNLLVVGDGQQQIFPGGYTLAEAGISVAGRATVLRTNYRNAANIIATSAALVADDQYNDLEAQSEAGRRDVVVSRPDGQVWQVELATAAEVAAAAVAHIGDLIAAGHDRAGIALLGPTNDSVESYQRALTKAGHTVVSLNDYAGVPVDAIKVGTYQRAKGLEFSDVVLPILDRQRRTGGSAEARQELQERANRTLFVAMTRARDTLWIGRLAAV